jgi:E3 ubiquitin-protein ligase makorin
MFFRPSDQQSQSSTENIWGSEAPDAHPAWTSNDQSSSALNFSAQPFHRVSSAAVCKFFLSNSCTAGQHCRFSHNVPHTVSQGQWICEICSEDVLQKGLKFGLLENCDHMFCLNCIREWRNQKEKQDRLNLRKCPICRVDSFVIVPSSQFLTGAAKAAEKDQYVHHLSRIPCKNFEIGKTNCPFGSSCLYYHAGQSAVDTFTVIKGADGTRTKKGTQLSDFLKL